MGSALGRAASAVMRECGIRAGGYPAGKSVGRLPGLIARWIGGMVTEPIADDAAA